MSGLHSTVVRPVEAALMRADKQTGQMEGECDEADWPLSLADERTGGRSELS